MIYAMADCSYDPSIVAGVTQETENEKARWAVPKNKIETDRHRDAFSPMWWLTWKEAAKWWWATTRKKCCSTVMRASVHRSGVLEVAEMQPWVEDKERQDDFAERRRWWDDDLPAALQRERKRWLERWRNDARQECWWSPYIGTICTRGERA